MSIPFKEKMILCKTYVERTRFRYHVGLPRIGRVLRRASGTSALRRIDSRRRTANLLVRSCDINNHLFRGFLTLTFKQNEQNHLEASRFLTIFMQRLARHLGRRPRYVGCLEYQKRGAIHYHFLVDFDFIEFQTLFNMWGQGRVHFQKITDSNSPALIHYLSAYMRKSTQAPFGYRALFRSQGLDKPIEVFDSDIYALLQVFHSSMCQVWSVSYDIPKTANFCEKIIYATDINLLDFCYGGVYNKIDEYF